MNVSTTEEIFSAWHRGVTDEIRCIRQGTRLSELSNGIAREEWNQLSIAMRTEIQIFAQAIVEHRPDKTSMLGDEMLNFISGHTAAAMWANPSAVKVLKLLLGESE
jgi:hypothetical protein